MIYFNWITKISCEKKSGEKRNAPGYQENRAAEKGVSGWCRAV